MRYLIIVLLLSATTIADEFEWARSDTKITSLDLPTKSGLVSIVAGSMCSGEFCDISVKFSHNNAAAVEFVRETANAEAIINRVDDLLEINLLYYPAGNDFGVQESRYYKWNSDSKRLELTNVVKQQLDI